MKELSPSSKGWVVVTILDYIDLLKTKSSVIEI